MKFLKKTVAVALACLALTAAAGCDNRKYGLYTNIAEGGFEILDASFNAEVIPGYVPENREFEEIDSSNFETYSFRYFAMTADAELAVAADYTVEGTLDRFKEFAQTVKILLADIDKALSTTVANSDVSLFNGAKPGEEIEIRGITYEVLSTALSVYNLTDGYYNPALYYNIYAYGFGGSHNLPQSAAELPSDEIIAKYTDLATHFGEVALDTREGKYYVQKPEYTVEAGGETLSMKIDLGGIGKGYAVDRVDELFGEYNFSYGYFDFGASSKVVKSFKNGGNYNILLTNPRSIKRDPYIMIPARNEKMSTSGDDNQRYFIDGVRYCHIIDPTTGKPVQTGIMSATIIGGSAAEDDALTTAIMAMGKERAVQFIEQKLTDRRVVFVCE